MDSDYYQHELKSRESGSTVSGIKQVELLKTKVIIPPLPTQRAIAAVLSSLDDKIELLRSQNKTLEELAQTIFREWFVNFNFPNEQGKPYKKSGGEMVDSELGEVPEEWEINKIGNYVDIKGGSTPSTKDPNFWNGDIHWTSPKDLSNSKTIFLLNTEKRITATGLKRISSGLMPKGTLLLSSRAPIGYLAISDIDISINQGYIAFLPGATFSNYFMFLWLRQNMNRVKGTANGSTFLEISKTAFKSITCLAPGKKILNQFDSVAQPIFQKILSNLHQIQTLSTFRTLLLPKLMRGEVGVKI